MTSKTIKYDYNKLIMKPTPRDFPDAKNVRFILTMVHNFTASYLNRQESLIFLND